jgi:hypothetical protein
MTAEHSQLGLFVPAASGWNGGTVDGRAGRNWVRLAYFHRSGDGRLADTASVPRFGQLGLFGTIIHRWVVRVFRGHFLLLRLQIVNHKS